jgi:hypothetical protein
MSLSLEADLDSLLSYDPSTCLALLYDPDYALLVDVSLSLDGWVNETKGIVMVIGHLERSDVSHY